jgi:hypothetical protein
VGNGDHTLDTWPLWSWQTADIKLADYTPDHKKSPWNNLYSKYSELCEQLAKRLGLENDQFICCYTQAGVDKDKWKNCKEWELSVPKDRVHLICDIAWDGILSHSRGQSHKVGAPLRLIEFCQEIISPSSSICMSSVREDCDKQFENDWKDKTTKELWDMISVNEIWHTCTTALVLCPIEEGWIKPPS